MINDRGFDYHTLRRYDKFAVAMISLERFNTTKYYLQR